MAPKHPCSYPGCAALVGNLFTVRGRKYLAYFCAPFPKYRWLEIDRLPYTG
jgi:hypothetical protein